MEKPSKQPSLPQVATSQSSSQNADNHAVILCTAGYDRTIRFWEALSGICSRTIQHPDSQVNKLAISADKKYLAVAGNPNTRIYEALSNNGNSSVTLEGHTANVTSVAFHASNKWIVTGSEDGNLKIFDLRAKGAQREFSHKCPVNDVVIHPNQGEIISCDLNGSIKFWDMSSNACVHELIPEEDVAMRSVSIASDASCLVAGNNKGNVFVWKMGPDSLTDASTLKTHNITPYTKIKAHNKYLLRSILSPDARSIATTSADHTIKLWKFTQPNLSLSAAQNSLKDSQRRIDDEELTGNSLLKVDQTLVGHQRWVWDCAFSADSEYLVSSSSDHTARLWDLSSGETIRQYQGHHKAAVCIALNDTSQ